MWLSISESLEKILGANLFKVGQFSLSVEQVVTSTIIILVTYIVLKVAKRIIHKRFHERQGDKGKAHSFFQLLNYFTWIFIFVVILDILHFKLTYIVGASAAIFVGIGLGMQDLFKDTISGLFMLMESNVRVNEVMEVDKIVGRVQRIGLRTSTIKSRDGISIIIPNHKFISENVVNWTNESIATRFRIEVLVSFDSDVNLVKELLLKSTDNHNKILHNIEGMQPSVRLNSIGEYAVHFLLFFWTQHTFTVETIKSDVRFKILQNFRENNIQIPFPQREIHIQNRPIEDKDIK